MVFYQFIIIYIQNKNHLFLKKIIYKIKINQLFKINKIKLKNQKLTQDHNLLKEKKIKNKKKNKINQILLKMRKKN